MNDHARKNEDLSIRTGIKAGEAAQIGSGMMGGGGATAPGGSTFGSGN